MKKMILLCCFLISSVAVAGPSVECGFAIDGMNYHETTIEPVTISGPHGQGSVTGNMRITRVWQCGFVSGLGWRWYVTNEFNG